MAAAQPAPSGSDAAPGQGSKSPQEPFPPTHLHTRAKVLTHTFHPTVDIAALTVPQLRSLQTRLNSELEHLTNSHSKLRTAQTKFKDCVSSINVGVVKDDKKEGGGKDEILVPLTTSLYVKGKMADREKVIVDVGTGFYVEKVRFCLIGYTGERGMVLTCIDETDYPKSNRVL